MIGIRPSCHLRVRNRPAQRVKPGRQALKIFGGGLIYPVGQVLGDAPDDVRLSGGEPVKAVNGGIVDGANVPRSCNQPSQGQGRRNFKPGVELARKRWSEAAMANIPAAYKVRSSERSRWLALQRCFEILAAHSATKVSVSTDRTSASIVESAMRMGRNFSPADSSKTFCARCLLNHPNMATLPLFQHAKP
jgi:hypothetical protein